MEKLTKSFNDIERNIRQNNLAMIGLFILLFTLIIAFSISFYKMYVYESSRYLVLQSDGVPVRTHAVSGREAQIIEIKDFMSSFYGTFYSFDQYTIDTCLNLAFYKGDESLRNLYARYRNQGWYNTILQDNISQRAVIESFDIDVDSYPFKVSVKGTLYLQQADNVRKIPLNGSCQLFEVTRQFPRNPHGLFIHNWKEDRHG
jgi:hypothetical protein